MTLRLRGFTYLELTLVATIVGVLAAIAVPNFLHAQIRAKVAANQTDLAMLSMCLEHYFDDAGAYPPNLLLPVRVPSAQPLEAYPFSLCVLTSPLPYTTQLPRDIFLDKHEPYLPYGYIQFASGDLPVETTPLGRPGWGRYVLYGMGPDQQVTSPFFCDYMFDPNRVIVIHYDPTNGITSRGDIVDLGPH